MTTTFGPPLKVGNPNFPVPGQPYQDGSPSWRRDDMKATLRRKKPIGIGLLTQPTAYSSHHIFNWKDVDKYKADSSIRAEPSYPCVQPTNWNRGTSVNVREAWSSLLEKVQNNKFDTMTSLAELPETVKWIGQSARDMLNAYRYVKTGKWSRALDSWARGKNRLFKFKRRNGSYYHRELAFDNRLASRYLEWRFAVQPLVSDLDNFLEALYTEVSNPLYRVAKGRSSSSEPITFLWSKGIKRVKVNAFAVYRIDTDTAELQKWGGINLVSTLYNVIPLSFMVDRFLPIGDYLANLDADMGITWFAKTTSHRVEWSQQGNPPANGSWVHARCTCEAQSYERIIGTDGFSNTFPTDFKFEGDEWTTAIDSLALARQFLNSTFK